MIFEGRRSPAKHRETFPKRRPGNTAVALRIPIIDWPARPENPANGQSLFLPMLKVKGAGAICQQKNRDAGTIARLGVPREENPALNDGAALGPASPRTAPTSPVHGACRDSGVGPPVDGGSAVVTIISRQPRSRGFSWFGFSH